VGGGGGAGTVWAARHLGHAMPERVAGYDLAQELLRCAPAEGRRVYFFGSAPGVAEKAREKAEQLYPGIEIVGVRNGFFKDEDNAKIIEEIRTARPDLLLVALGVAKFIVKRDNMQISNSLLDNYFFWVEIGVILGARLGYIVIYDPNTAYYLTHPWQIFNPFHNGEFVGIRGMSYHGAVVGFLIATWAFCRKFKQNLWQLLDLVALSIPLGYFFGRIGNFLNQELFGRITDVSWAINVAGQMRHPSQIYEAVLEGLAVFAILFVFRKFCD